HAENFELLRKIMATIKMFDNPRVVVSGHTDATGSQDKNEALSYMRADNVVTFLREISSIPANRLVARGFGEEHPIASNDTQEGRMRNRRIEVLIVNE
ncbi:MAG: OmpA family protein, partial [Methylococcales bacterium]|nr:OmpA family protein [Methylococcales bacterium]